jgi:hypothetical protein
MLTFAAGDREPEPHGDEDSAIPVFPFPVADSLLVLLRFSFWLSFIVHLPRLASPGGAWILCHVDLDLTVMQADGDSKSMVRAGCNSTIAALPAAAIVYLQLRQCNWTRSSC